MTVKLDATLTDRAVLIELGQRLAQLRLGRGLTQAQLAEQAGVAKRTLERVESGESSQLLTLIRLLRVLGMLDRLDGLVPSSTVGPMALLRELRNDSRDSHARRRAPARPAAVTRPSEWQWAE